MSDYNRVQRLAARCLIFLVLLLKSTFLWADLNYDRDDDCDVDGIDLLKLLSAKDNKIEYISVDFASEFGTTDACCNPIEVDTPINGYPSWQERTVIVFTNIVRMAPTEYRDIYMVGFTFPAEGILNLYPAVAPLYWKHELNLSARFHAEDMAFNCQTLQHDSCDCTSWHVRITSFYLHTVAPGENFVTDLQCRLKKNFFKLVHLNLIPNDQDRRFPGISMIFQLFKIQTGVVWANF